MLVSDRYQYRQVLIIFGIGSVSVLKKWYWASPNIYIFIQTPLKFGCIFSEALCVSSLELHPGGLNYTLAQQRRTGQTTVLHALTLVHIYIYIYIYAFSRRFYPKRLTIAFRLYICNQYVCSLGIEPTTFCAADAMLYHWATQELLYNWKPSFNSYWKRHWLWFFMFNTVKLLEIRPSIA